MSTRQTLQTAHMLITRLERLSADSVWAHRASGMRGSLLRQVELVKNEGTPGNDVNLAFLEDLFKSAYSILANAAREIPDTAARKR